MKAEWCKISLFFLFVVAFIGTLLRLVAYVPIPFKYTNFVHAHSHTAFQVWFYLTMFLLFANTFVTYRKIEKKKYDRARQITIYENLNNGDPLRHTMQKIYKLPFAINHPSSVIIGNV